MIKVLNAPGTIESDQFKHKLSVLQGDCFSRTEKSSVSAVPTGFFTAEILKLTKLLAEDPSDGFSIASRFRGSLHGDEDVGEGAFQVFQKEDTFLFLYFLKVLGQASCFSLILHGIPSGCLSQSV